MKLMEAPCVGVSLFIEEEKFFCNFCGVEGSYPQLQWGHILSDMRVYPIESAPVCQREDSTVPYAKAQ
jgi:hypothetical protein